MISKFNFAFVLFILILVFASIFFLDNKKTYFQSVEIGNEIHHQFGYKHSINKITNFETYLSELNDIIQKSNYDFIWGENDHYLIYFFSNNINNFNEKINSLDIKVKKLDKKFKKNFSKIYKDLDYSQYKQFILNDNPRWLKNNINIHHSIHRNYIFTNNMLKNLDQKIINSEKIIYMSIRTPKYKEYLYKNINNNFVFKSVLILLISSLISFLFIFKSFR